jgi:ankyrin repeat protein
MEVLAPISNPPFCSNLIINAMDAHNEPEIYRLIDEYGLNTRDEMGDNCLFFALYAESLELFDELVQRGAEFLINKYRLSVLGCLADNSWSGNYRDRAFHHIVNKYADRITVTIDDLKAWLFYDNGINYRTAEEIPSSDPFKILLNLGPDINALSSGDYQSTILHSITNKSSLGYIQLLLQLGANPNIPDSEGQTVLHLIAEINRPSKILLPNNIEISREVIKLLVNHGANPCLRDNKGRTPLEIMMDPITMYFYELTHKTRDSK